MTFILNGIGGAPEFIAAKFGFADYLKIPAGTRAKRMGARRSLAGAGFSRNIAQIRRTSLERSLT